jgi:hypothetical protein
MTPREAKQLALGVAYSALRKEEQSASERATRASQARASLPPGSSRAKVTSANARWSTACTEADRLRGALEWVSSEILRQARSTDAERLLERLVAQCRSGNVQVFGGGRDVQAFLGALEAAEAHLAGGER